MVALATGLVDAAPKLTVAASDVPPQLSAEQTIDDGTPSDLFLVPAIPIAVPVRGAFLLPPVPQATWLAWNAISLDLARAPPRQDDPEPPATAAGTPTA
jgi:hypothetical protein